MPTAHPDLVIILLGWTGWTTAVCLALLQFLRNRNITFTVVDEYDETTDIDRLILSASIVIKESKRNHLTQFSATEQE